MTVTGCRSSSECTLGLGLLQRHRGRRADRSPSLRRDFCVVARSIRVRRACGCARLTEDAASPTVAASCACGMRDVLLQQSINSRSISSISAMRTPVIVVTLQYQAEFRIRQLPVNFAVRMYSTVTALRPPVSAMSPCPARSAACIPGRRSVRIHDRPPFPDLRCRRVARQRRCNSCAGSTARRRRSRCDRQRHLRPRHQGQGR